MSPSSHRNEAICEDTDAEMAPMAAKLNGFLHLAIMLRYCQQKRRRDEGEEKAH